MEAIKKMLNTIVDGRPQTFSHGIRNLARWKNKTCLWSKSHASAISVHKGYFFKSNTPSTLYNKHCLFDCFKFIVISSISCRNEFLT